MRDGEVVQIGRPEEVVGAPGRRLCRRLRAATSRAATCSRCAGSCGPLEPTDPLGRPGVRRLDGHPDALEAAASTDKPIRVVHGRRAHRRGRPGQDPRAVADTVGDRLLGAMADGQPVGRRARARRARLMATASAALTGRSLDRAARRVLAVASARRGRSPTSPSGANGRSPTTTTRRCSGRSTRSATRSTSNRQPVLELDPGIGVARAWSASFQDALAVARLARHDRRSRARSALLFGGWRLALLRDRRVPVARACSGCGTRASTRWPDAGGGPDRPRSSGIPLGILAGRSDRVPAVLAPVLDVMQIMPTFAYLAPMTLLFLIGAPPAIDRHADLRDPGGDPDHRAGHPRACPRPPSRRPRRSARPGAQVLRKVQLRWPGRAIVPGGQPDDHAGAVDGRDHRADRRARPGSEHRPSAERVNVGAAFDAGLAIVILAIILDRLTLAPAMRWTRAVRAGSGGRATAGSPSACRSPSLVVGLAAPSVVDATDSRTHWRFSFARPGQRPHELGHRTF